MLGLTTADGSVRSVKKRVIWFDIVVLTSVAFGVYSICVGIVGLVTDPFEKVGYCIAFSIMIAALSSYVLNNYYPIIQIIQNKQKNGEIKDGNGWIVAGVVLCVFLVLGSEITVRVLAIINLGASNSTVGLTLLTIFSAIPPVVLAPSANEILRRAYEQEPAEEIERSKRKLATTIREKLTDAYATEIQSMKNTSEIITSFGNLMTIEDILSGTQPKTLQERITSISEEKPKFLLPNKKEEDVQSPMPQQAAEGTVKEPDFQQESFNSMEKPIDLTTVRRSRGRPRGSGNKKKSYSNQAVGV